jgi:hypothetical protein
VQEQQNHVEWSLAFQIGQDFVAIGLVDGLNSGPRRLRECQNAFDDFVPVPRGQIAPQPCDQCGLGVAVGGTGIAAKEAMLFEAASTGRPGCEGVGFGDQAGHEDAHKGGFSNCESRFQ